MDVDLLGPLAAWQGDVLVTPTAEKPRKLLALLALTPGQLVPKTTMFDELWGDEIPRYAHNLVQTYIMHLRNRIGSASGEPVDPKRIVVTSHGGYLLDTVGRIDVQEFDRLAFEGHRAHALGDYETASKLFTAAMAVWRDRAFVDVEAGPVLEAEAHRLEETRLNVLDRRIDADLRLGRHHQLLGELAGLVRRYRAHEGMHAHFMVALHRSGRRSEAAEVYRRLHSRLVSQFGLEPSPKLRRLQQAILVSDSALDLQPRTAALAAPAL